MEQLPNQTTPVDGRLISYKSVRRFAVIIGIMLVIKFFIFDSIVIQTPQMSPTLIRGDRVLVFKTPFAPITRQWFSVHTFSPVVFFYPHKKRTMGCLRIAGIGGDSLAIIGGMCENYSRPFAGARLDSMQSVLPTEYAPRDFMTPFIVPQAGTTIIIDSLSLRDFIFAASTITQENESSRYTIKPLLRVDGKALSNYFIIDFSLYRGLLDSIPAASKFDWFFWAQLERYLQTSFDTRQVELKLTLLQNDQPLEKYTYANDFVFLLADNWAEGYDSRYIGPVCVNRITGPVISVLWSTAGSFYKVRFNRLGKLIH